jgi:hypothetical protein
MAVLDRIRLEGQTFYDQLQRNDSDTLKFDISDSGLETAKARSA